MDAVKPEGPQACSGAKAAAETRDDVGTAQSDDASTCTAKSEGWETLVAGAIKGSNDRKASFKPKAGIEKRRPAPSWTNQDLGPIAGLIASHLQRCEKASQQISASAAQGGGAAKAGAEPTSGQERVAVVVDELAMQIAEHALSNMGNK
jgi:hypothetical protein